MGKGSMAAIASVLDDDHSERVRALWSALEAGFGLTTASISPLPHFSYQCARDYQLEVLQEIVEKIAAKARPLRVRVTGLGVFPGESPVVYLPVVRSPELTRLQIALWSAGAVATEKPLREYHPAAWIPHITIAQGDVTPEILPRVIADLNEANLMWEFTVDNLSIIRGRGDQPQELLCRFDFQGGSARNF